MSAFDEAVRRDLADAPLPASLDRLRQLARRRRSRKMMSGAVAVVLVAIGVGLLIDPSRHSGTVAVRPSNPPTTTPSPSSTGTVTPSTPQTRLCVLRHASGDLYSLAQPVSITLPGRYAIPIVPGNPITTPTSVTLDRDGSTDPGQPSNAASLLWGASTPGGPFSGIDHLALGQMVTLRQTLRTSTGPFDCIQRWRIVRIFTPPGKPWTEPTLLRLVGFAGHGQAGPSVQLYVDAIPA